MIKAASLRVTPGRVEILKVLVDAARPLSHSEVQEKIPLADRVTVYRTLEIFVKKEAAHQVQGPDGAWRFCAQPLDTAECPGNHPHFLCLSCGKMICLPDQKLPRVHVPDGFSVGGKQLVVYGKCDGCEK
jgi:Fur family ferric uptake transcriptional regulator/Fur family zinc uptake transcriptional regulator